jgi:hypothetical protein
VALTRAAALFAGSLRHRFDPRLHVRPRPPEGVVVRRIHSEEALRPAERCEDAIGMQRAGLAITGAMDEKHGHRDPARRLHWAHLGNPEPADEDGAGNPNASSTRERSCFS